MGKASQIDLEIVRECAAILGLGAGGGDPALEARVTALEGSVGTLETNVSGLTDTVGNLETTVNDHDDILGNLAVDAIPYAWVVFDGTAAPDPVMLGGRANANVARVSPGVYEFTCGIDFGSTEFGVLFSASDGATVTETGRTSTTVEVSTGVLDTATRITIALFGTPVEPV